MLVTFDSNVWRPVADPSRFPNSPEHASFVSINACLISRAIQGVLCETVFTLEGIARKDRRKVLASYTPNIKVTASGGRSGTIKLGLGIGPDTAAHPGNNPYLSSHLTDALAVGFKLMRCPRVAGIQNSDLRAEWFIPTSHESANKFGEVARRIEAVGAGIAQIKAIGNKYAKASEPWFDGLARAPSSEDSAIAEAVAEWADGDSVAAHVANGISLFCTNDLAVAAGNASALSSPNRLWLETDFGVKFVSPSELATHV